MRLIIEVKNPTEELTGHILLTLVVGYFAIAQYDVLFLLVIASRRRPCILVRYAYALRTYNHSRMADRFRYCGYNF